MIKSRLIETAKKLKLPSPEAAVEYENKREQIVFQMNEAMLARTDLSFLIGEGHIPMMKDNHKNHALFVSSILASHQPEALVETMLWVFRTYRSHGFDVNYWPAQLNQWIEILETNLSETSLRQIYPFYNWFLTNHSAFIKLSDNADGKI